MAIVVGTAGHIDHGKTALVKALTGVDTDRLPIEKQRGITTELGFAPLELAGQRIAMVDVPGHERFVKSMVAGATGIDVVVMVIAADEGTMPQTREHLAICDLLGVERGVIALTKSDLVDEEGLALARADVAAAVAGTFLEDAAVVPVSARTGAGLDELRTALAAAIASVAPRPTTGVFRLAIDRVFTKKGFGTIVTGTVLGGEVRVGDELHLIPSGLAARVRGLEVHGAAVEVAKAGQRCAINLGGVAVEDLARGDMVVHPERVLGSHILDVELRTLEDLPARSKVLLHHGTAQVLATLVRLDGKLAQLRIDRETPVGALPGDHFIIRGFERSPLHGSTLGGGTVIRVLAPKARRSHAEVVAALARAKLDQQLVHFVKATATTG
ncbi:MAG TPA: selenocysteine-specific translation elongation factor, partial [Kofleriaceae bacterium]